MGYRVIRTSDAWVRLLWPHDYAHGKDVTTLLKTLCRVPGVREQGNYVDLPCTVWNLPQVHTLWRMLGCDAPQLAERVSAEWLPGPTLFEHQTEAVEKLLSVTGVLLADSMGLGKTRSAITAAERVRRAHSQAGRPVLVLGTLSSRDVWRNELRAINPHARFHALEGRDINEGWDGAADWYFAHFDIVLAWMTRLQGRKPCVGIIDESHTIRNGRTQRGRGANAVIGTVPQRILLTGTPIENHPGDLWHQLQIMTGQGTWGSPVEFRVRYAGATHSGFGYKDGDTPTHVDELRARMSPFYLRRDFKDVAMSMPALTRQLQVVPLKLSLQQEHDAALNTCGVEQLVRALQEGSLRSDVLATMTRLRQVTSQGKLDATAEYIANAQEQGEGVVVFTWEQATAAELGRRSGGFVLTGADSQPHRAQVIETFQATPGAVLVATLGALRESVTLHTARLVVMHDWHWVLAHMLQGEARVWRTGQRRACHSVWMMCENSIDSILARVLYAKAAAMQVTGIDKGHEALEELGIGQLARDQASSRVNDMLEAWL